MILRFFFGRENEVGADRPGEWTVPSAQVNSLFTPSDLMPATEFSGPRQPTVHTRE
jgi:hypothetical protein